MISQKVSRKNACKIVYIDLFLLLSSVLIIFFLSEVIVRIFIPVRIIGPSLTIYDPIYGKRLKKSFVTKRITPEFTFHFTTNSMGFRGPEFLSTPHRPILFLGDSFTMGYGVNDGEEYPAVVSKTLEKHFGMNEIPVLNTGMGNNGNGRWIKFLRKEGEKFNPRFVVFQISENDFDDNFRERLFDLTPSGELQELPVPSQSISRIAQKAVEYIPGLSYSYFVGLVRQGLFILSLKWKSFSRTKTLINSNQSKEQLTFHLIEEVFSICNSKNWPMIVLIVGITGQRLNELEMICRLYDIPIIKVPDKNEYPEFYYPIDEHWNNFGHQFVAKLIIEQLLTIDNINPKKY